MGYMHMSGLLKQSGHAVDVFIDNCVNEELFLAELRCFKPDIVGFSILTNTMTWASRITKLVHEATGALTVFGNVHAILNPEVIETLGLQAVCISEGEYPLLDLARHFDDGTDYLETPGFWFKTTDGIVRNGNRDGCVDLELLPPLDLGLYDKFAMFRRSRVLQFILGRGCPFKCSFCANPNLQEHFGEGYVRKRNPEAAVGELEELVRARKPDMIFFYDEVFWVRNDWLREFLTLYRDRIGLPFHCNFRFGSIEESDVQLLAEAGCRSTAVATESGDEHQRCRLLNKLVSDDQILQTGRLLRKHGIRFASSVFFGLPGDTVADHMDRLSFFRQLKPDYLWTTFFTPFPKLALTEELQDQNLLHTDLAFDSSFHRTIWLKDPDQTQIVNLKKVYHLMFLWPWSVPILLRLTPFKIPILFDLLFAVPFAHHMSYYMNISYPRLIHHLLVYAIFPDLMKKRRIASVMRFVYALKVRRILRNNPA